VKRLLSAALLYFLLSLFGIAAHAAEISVLLSSSTVVPGDTLRMELDNISPELQMKADLFHKSYAFFAVGPAAQRALVGVPLGTAPGKYVLHIHGADRATANEFEQNLIVLVSTRIYETENINLPATKNVLMQSEHRESAHIHQLALKTTHEQYWEGVFQFPVEGPLETPFGLKRTRNGTIDAGFHKGVDIKAKDGAALVASNAGVVVLAAPYKAHGRVVMIDHGQGVMTIYLHLQKMMVQPGQKVAKGAIIGKVGSTGLATGPHVHWQVFVHSVPVDPIPWTQQEF
jgi:murein DD-endopeptidase MepM/ murein hydrolase activator NlpD